MSVRAVIDPILAQSRPALRLAVFCAALALGACASETARTDGTFASGARPAEPFKKILVVGVSPDRNGRCPFERFMLSRLEGEVTEAIASCDVMSKDAPLTRELVEQTVVEQHVDAVLATLLVSQDWNAQHGGSRDTRGSAGYKATDSGWASGYYGVYGVPVVYGEFQSNAASIVIKGNVKLTSRLFETRGKTIVYTVDTSAKGIESRDTGLSLLADAIGERLMKDGLIK